MSAFSMGHLAPFKEPMSKCHERELSNVFRALLQDARSTFPTLEVEFEKDLTHLLRLVERRGIRVYLDDLPAVCKHLDRCLAGGQYCCSGLTLTARVSSRIQIPKFLRGLYLLVFHKSGSLREDCNIEAIFFLRQLLSFAKKVTLTCTAEQTAAEVLEFFVTDGLLPEVDYFWTSAGSTQESIGGSKGDSFYEGFHRSALYASRVDPLDTRKRIQLSIFLATLDIVSSVVTTTLGSYDPREWRFKHGPGAVSEITGPSNKYCWTNWSDSLEHEYPIADYGFHSFSSWADTVDRNGLIGSREPLSRMVAVPKSHSKPRLIAAEPSEHMWCQQNLRHYFAQRTEDSWIGRFVHFDDQTPNQLLCTLGARTGTLATVDLSAASDRVSCHLVGNFFRKNLKLLNCLRASRTHIIQQTLTHIAPRVAELRKFSTMGSACTFPIETLVFLGVAISAVLTTRHLKATPRNIRSLAGEVAVFGDDIVIPVDSRELFVEALEVLHFKVNVDKSYWTGKFRESCGVDSFDGVNVTPCYWKTFYDGTPESLSSVVECHNNFYKRFLLNTCRYLESTLPAGVPAVDMFSGVLGLKTRLRPRHDELRVRHNLDLQRVEVLVKTLIGSQRRLPTNDDTALLQFFTEAPDPTEKWMSGVPQRPRSKIEWRWVALSDLATQLD